MRHLLLFTLGCNGDKSDSQPTETETTDSAEDTGTEDADKDGFAADVDCDDEDPAVYPGAVEVCDDIDNDCDKEVDEAATDATTYYADNDGDGYGVKGSTAVACEPPKGFASRGDDCDDAHADAHPGAKEIWYNGIDNACDGGDDYDQDGDGFSKGVDCDDERPSANPKANEFCNGLDDDCDKAIDEDAYDRPNWYLDADGDDFGLDKTAIESCEAPKKKGNWVLDGGDCQDDNKAVNPSAIENCSNLTDDDCDGGTDNCRYSVAGAGARYSGVYSGEQAGTHIASLDLNGDSRGDIAVGAPANSEIAKEAGAAYVIYGPLDSNLDLDDADVIIEADGENNELGRWVANAGDIDDDGTADDLVVGALGHAPFGVTEGSAMIIYGPAKGRYTYKDADVLIFAESGFDRTGEAVQGIGDLNDDGNADLAVGASGDSAGGTGAGAVFLLWGPLTTDIDLASPDAKYVGEEAGDFAGRAIAAPVDVTGDGVDDLALGAYGHASKKGASAGALYVFEGPVNSGTVDLSTADVKQTGTALNEYAGFSVAAAGDLDDDGKDDLVVGAYGNAGFTGAAYVVHGPATGTSLADAHAVLLGEAAADLAGHSVAGGGDLNDDGDPDLVIGAHGEDGGGGSAGAGYVVLGPVTGTLELDHLPRAYNGGSAGDFLGFSVAIVPDTNMDGVDELALGAPSLGANEGGAYVIPGSNTW